MCECFKINVIGTDDDGFLVFERECCDGSVSLFRIDAAIIDAYAEPVCVQFTDDDV